jgi:hypothetical protein
VPGMLWINDAAGPTNWILNVYMSPTIGDRPLFAYNTVTGEITVAAAAGGTIGAAVLLAQAAASPAVQWNATANPIDAKAWRMTVNGAGALVLSSYNDAGVLQQSFTFNRDGSLSTGQPIFRMVAETILAAAAVDIRVTVPAGAKAIELWFQASTFNGANDVLGLNTMNGAAIITTLTHNTQYGIASGAAASGSYVANANHFQFGNGISASAGIIRPQWVAPPGTTQILGTGQVWGVTATATKFALNISFDGPIAVQPTGFRLAWVGGINFSAGSYLRAFAAI